MNTTLFSIYSDPLSDLVSQVHRESLPCSLEQVYSDKYIFLSAPVAKKPQQNDYGIPDVGPGE